MKTKRSLWIALLFILSAGAVAIVYFLIPDPDAPGFDYFSFQCGIYNAEKILMFKTTGEMCSFRDDGSYVISSPMKGKLEFFTPDDSVVWNIPLHAHHDMKLVDNGESILIVTSEHINFHGETVRADCFSKRNIRDGLPVFQWCLSQHMQELEALGYKFKKWKIPGTNVAPQYPNEISHANSIYEIPENPRAKTDPAFKAGNFLVTFFIKWPVLLILDSKMEKILWTKDLERFNTGGKIYEVGAHDSQVTPQGTIFSYFNDMRNRDDKILCAPEGPPVSSLVEFDPTTNEILWQHSHPGFSAETLGSCERQKNGNILYSEANAGKAYVTTPEGKVVWKFVNPELSGKGEPQPFGKIRAQSVKFLKARGLVE